PGLPRFGPLSRNCGNSPVQSGGQVRRSGPETITMRASLSLKQLLPAACLLLAAVAHPASAGQQDHQVSNNPVQAGLRLYTSECALCHGPNGDLMSGIDLRRGRFRRAVSDEDLMRVISGGVPAAGMPSFNKLQAADVTALVAFIRAGFDVSGAAV